MKRSALLVLACMLWYVPQALAEPNVAIGAFDGRNATQLRAKVTRALSRSQRVSVISSPRVARAARKLRADLTSEEGRASVAGELSASAIVEGSVTRRGRAYELQLRVFSGATGVLHGTESVRAPRVTVTSALRRWLLRELQVVHDDAVQSPAEVDTPVPEVELEPEPEIESSEPTEDPEPPPPPQVTAPEAEPEPARELEPEPFDDSEISEPSDDAPRALEIEVAVRVLSRGVDYVKPSVGSRGQQYSLAPAGRIDARWYPAAHFTTAFVSNLGFDLHAQWMLPSSVAWGSSEYTVDDLVLGAALRVRLPIAAHELGTFAGYEQDVFEISRSKFREAPKSPGFTSGRLRFGADARLALSSWFTLGASGAFVLPRVSGTLVQREWYPHASAGLGWQAELSARFAFSRAWSLRIVSGMQRSSFDLKVDENTDLGAIVFGRSADALTDQTLFGSIGIALCL